MEPQIIYDKFFGLFKEVPILVRSPGRINLIGEHTDYNEGLVLPAAIDKEIVLAVAPTDSDNCKLYAVDYQQFFEFRLEEIQKSETSWYNYFLGVLDEFSRRDVSIQPFNCAFGGDIPIGGGLSSSAALACGFAFALNELFDLELSKLDLVRIGHQAENNFVGVRCGIMDQFANIFSRKDHVLKLDCRSLEYELIPFAFREVSLLLLDTQISHDLASSEYNLRRQQCEAGMAEIKKVNKSVRSLRDVSPELLQEIKPKLHPVIFKRCDYVVQEIERVMRACEALKRNELNNFGELMFETHAGLRNDYEVSCPELDFLVESAQSFSGVIGARLMGGGFGGCTINLVHKSSSDEFASTMQKQYRSELGKALKIYNVRIESGTSRLNL
jgi:galactokinase